MTPAEAVAKLDQMTGEYPGMAHSAADEILLACVPEDVRAAYERLVERTRWWITE